MLGPRNYSSSPRTQQTLPIAQRCFVWGQFAKRTGQVMVVEKQSRHRPLPAESQACGAADQTRDLREAGCHEATLMVGTSQASPWAWKHLTLGKAQGKGGFARCFRESRQGAPQRRSSEAQHNSGAVGYDAGGVCALLAKCSLPGTSVQPMHTHGRAQVELFSHCKSSHQAPQSSRHFARVYFQVCMYYLAGGKHLSAPLCS